MLSHELTSPSSILLPLARTKHCEAPAPRTLHDHFSRAPVRSFAAKEHVFTEGDPRSNLYRVESGAVCLYKVMGDGRRQVLGFAYPGDLVGLGACNDHQCNAQVTKRSQLRSVPWSTVQRLARQDPATWIEALRGDLRRSWRPRTTCCSRPASAARRSASPPSCWP